MPRIRSTIRVHLIKLFQIQLQIFRLLVNLFLQIFLEISFQTIFYHQYVESIPTKNSKLDCKWDPANCVNSSDRVKIESLLNRELLAVDDDQRDYLPYYCFLVPSPYQLPYYDDCLPCSTPNNGCPPLRGMPHIRGAYWNEVCEVYCWRDDRPDVANNETMTANSTSIATSGELDWPGTESETTSTSTPIRSSSPLLDLQLLELNETSNYFQEAYNKSPQTDSSSENQWIEGHSDESKNTPIDNLTAPQRFPAPPPPMVAGRIAYKDDEKELILDVAVYPAWAILGFIIVAAVGFGLALYWGCRTPKNRSYSRLKPDMILLCSHLSLLSFADL